MVKRKIILLVSLATITFLFTLFIACESIVLNREIIEKTEIIADENINPEPTLNNTFPSVPEKDSVMTMLICGVDKSRNLTDVIILARYNTTKNFISMLQIPRDTFVGDISSTGKINAIYAKKTDKSESIKDLKQVIENMFQIYINYTTIIDLDCFSKAVDLMGGIEFDMPDTIEYLPNKILYKGYQTLNGEQSQWLVRYRKGYANGDIGRLEMQKEFIYAIIKKSKSLDFYTITKIITSLYSNIKTDMSMMEIIKLLPKAYIINEEDIKLYLLDGYGKYYNNQAVYELDKEKTADILNKYFRFNFESIETKDLKIKTINGG